MAFRIILAFLLSFLAEMIYATVNGVRPTFLGASMFFIGAFVGLILNMRVRK